MLVRRHVPGIHPAEAFEPVVDGAVELEHVELLLDQGDERHEMLAVEPVFVEVARRTVGGGDDRHALVADQRAEQATHDHRVGAVVDHHLVEREAVQVLANRGGDQRDRIAALGLARLAQALVNLEHEGVEVDAALLGDG